MPRWMALLRVRLRYRLHGARYGHTSLTDTSGVYVRVRPAPPCPCECNRGGFCGGCGHAGCGGRRA